MDDIQFSLIDYDGSMSYARAYLVGLFKPIYRWIPSIAVSNFIFYNGNEFNELKGKVLLTSLKVKARTAILQDYHSGEILYEKEADTSIYPAGIKSSFEKGDDVSEDISKVKKKLKSCFMFY